MEKDDLSRFASILAEPKQRLLDEIRRVLSRTAEERYVDILAGGMASGRYGVCIDCGAPIEAREARDLPR